MFRYVGAIGAGFVFHLLGDRLPFPRHDLLVLCAGLIVYNSLLVPALLFADRLPSYLLYVVPAYFDLAIAFAFVHFTGGYLSPFLITPLLTVIGLNIVYLTDRRAGSWGFAILATLLVGMTVAHRTELLACPVPYAARLIRDDVFFWATFPTVFLLFTFGWLLARSTGGSIYVTITDLLATNQKLIERIAVTSETNARTDFLRIVAESFGGEHAFLIPTSDAPEDASLADQWTAGRSHESPATLRAMAPVRQALAAGQCLVPYGARHEFPECPVTRRIETSGCWIVVLRDEQGASIGVLGVLRQGPLQLDSKSEFLMRLFAVVGQFGLQRRIAEQATQAIRDQLHHSHKMEALGQLAGGVAHDFNNLLTVIIGATELLAEQVKERSLIHGYAQDVLSAGRRATDLVRHMLSFARRTPREDSLVDMHATLREVQRLLSHTIDKRIEVSIGLDAQRATVTGDVSQIQTALINVALNARDAMPQGGKLEFTTTNRELEPADLSSHDPGTRAGRYIEILCKDTGVGMEPEVLEKAFEPFFTTKAIGKGTGLGLAAVYGSVKSHGGFVEIESQVGIGTTVRIMLPVARLTANPGAIERAKTQVSTQAIHLLLAEDEALIANLMRHALERVGFEVDVCADGVAAVARYRENPERYALVLLDVMMPRLDGRQAFDVMRELNPDVRCVFVSGYSDETRIGSLLEEGRCGFVQKPFVLERLIEAIRAELDGSARAPAA